MPDICMRGVKTHNLKNIDVNIPRDKLVVITGPSGSGKSSLAFDTLYAESQRRFVESLSSYARQFLSVMEKPDVDSIEGLSPAISIEQKSTSHNPRSTVGTVTEIYDYLRLLFARAGEPRCPEHNTPLTAQSVTQIIDHIMAYPEGTPLMVLSPVVRHRKGEHQHLIDKLRAEGYIRARINDEIYELDDAPTFDKYKKHTIEVIVDRLKIRDDLRLRLADSIETAFRLSDGVVTIAVPKSKAAQDATFSSKHACAECGYSITDLEPKLFSFNDPSGACHTCDGLGLKQFFDVDAIVVDPNLSLSEGAIRGWDRRNNYYFSLLENLSEHFDFDIDQPFKKLRKKVKQIILYGSGDEEIEFTYRNDRGTVFQRVKTFEGVIPTLERRYRETDSRMIREDLAKLISDQPCPDCEGSRLGVAPRHVFIDNRNLPEITALSIQDAAEFFDHLNLPGKQGKIAEKILKEIRDRSSFLVNVGLNYLSLNRKADTLSGGEAQRIRLASQIGSGLVGVTYVLDEPSIGLHQNDNRRLIDTLTHLRDIGNSVVVVEHDEEMIREADHVIDIGPGAGNYGGQVVAEGTSKEITKVPDSLTGQYLKGEKRIEVPKQRNPFDPEHVLSIQGARGNNLKNIHVDIPVGALTCVTGVSGSGKSTLINHTLYPKAAKALNRAVHVNIAAHDDILGFEHFDKVIDIDQSPIGRTPRSNPATYTGLFTPIRELFANTQEARSRGYAPGRFSFNVKGGRCEACEGDGVTKVEMHFLADVYVPCDVCHTKRYNEQTLEIKYKGKNIYEVLEMTVEEALEFFAAIPSIARKLKTLTDVGLSYIRLGQSATTLSGGEAQRIKLSRELSKRDTGKTLYILDEPTTGLHFHDVNQLLSVIFRLRDKGNTIVIIEHNLDVIKTADWIIDLGPEGGHKGGQVVATGTPEAVTKVPGSLTGKWLKTMLPKAKEKELCRMD